MPSHRKDKKPLNKKGPGRIANADKKGTTKYDDLVKMDASI
jgi:hypothetical protein